MNWLIFLPQLSGSASRVRVWRRLQRAGAVSIKGAVWVLPDVPAANDLLTWLRHELGDEGVGGVIARARWVEGMTDAELVSEFRRLATARWDALVNDLQRANASQLSTMKRRFDEAVAGDYFKTQDGAVAARLIERLQKTKAPRGDGAESYLGRTWVTRRDIHVDRMTSCWLIRRFIDPRARLRFVDLARHQHQQGELRFDFQGAEFTHQGSRCTFEVLQHRFRPKDRALRFLGELVHDLDFKDDKFARPETSGFGHQLAAIASAHADDAARVERASAVLDDLYTLHSKK